MPFVVPLRLGALLSPFAFKVFQRREKQRQTQRRKENHQILEFAAV